MKTKLEIFIKLCEEFIAVEKIMSKDIKYVLKGDLDHLYRFISNRTNAWEVLADWKKEIKK